MTLPSWLGRAVRNWHRHAIEQVSRRWRGGRRDDSARRRREILISPQDFGDGEKNPNLITPEKYNELVKKHVMFKDMAADTYLASAGIADDWSMVCGNQTSGSPRH